MQSLHGTARLTACMIMGTEQVPRGNLRGIIRDIPPDRHIALESKGTHRSGVTRSVGLRTEAKARPLSLSIRLSGATQAQFKDKRSIWSN
ncbi:hypothetical protein VTN00DRAFT_442 [Thermoascus crustaceus]|uniref:uncharacterized protein n=1 Tax=Thermoascus crustaceus TaxID=5088 RepID=UPI003742C761